MTEQRFAERQQSGRKRLLRRLLLGSLAALVAGGLVWVVWFSGVLAVNRVQVEGATTLTPSDIRSQAAVRLGRPLAQVDTVGTESRVAGMERIDDVDVSRHWPRTIRITVEERKPIAWVLSGGEIRVLDRHGVDFRTFRSEPKDLVEVRIEATSARKRQQALESASAVIEELRADDADLLKQVRHVTAASKDSVKLALGKNRTVTWGSATRAEQKLTVLRSLLEIKARGYDVSAPEQPTTQR